MMRGCFSNSRRICSEARASCSLFNSVLSCGVYNCFPFQYKAELLQLNRIQFPSLGIFVSKKVGNQKKTKTTFIISVLKVVY